MNRYSIATTLLIAGCLAGTVDAKPPAHANNDSLPPGLQKNAERGKPLPPGWQKKLRVGDRLGADLYARGKVLVPVGDDGTVTVEVEGTLLKLRARTREILRIR